MKTNEYVVEVKAKGVKKFCKKLRYVAECLEKYTQALNTNTEAIKRHEEEWRKANFKEDE